MPDLLGTLRMLRRFEQDQPFTEVTATRLEAMDVVDGRWWVRYCDKPAAA